MTDAQIAALGDLDLLVQRSLAAVDAFGYGSYRHEHRKQAARNQEDYGRLMAEAIRRGLMDGNGALLPKGVVLDAENDPRVLAKEADNAAYFRARFGTGSAHTSPYGERYGR